jgi:hypothetical protein
MAAMNFASKMGRPAGWQAPGGNLLTWTNVILCDTPIPPLIGQVHGTSCPSCTRALSHGADVPEGYTDCDFLSNQDLQPFHANFAILTSELHDSMN